MNIEALAQKYNDFLITQRRWFHQHPEVSEKEFETSKHIKEELDKLGVAWRPCGLQTGVLATIKGAHPGKTILLRGDIDALTVHQISVSSSVLCIGALIAYFIFLRRFQPLY